MSETIQWYDSSVDRYLKYNEESGELIATKMTEGPFKDVKIVKTQPIDKSVEQTGRRRKKVNYLANKDLLIEFKKSMDQGQMTDKFAMMLQMLTQRISKKSNYVNYTYIDDMRSYAMVMLLGTWTRFDPSKSDKPNPFSYYTTCINHSFIQYLKKEKQQRDIRDKIMTNNGLTASHSYQMEHSNTNYDGSSDKD